MEYELTENAVIVATQFLCDILLLVILFEIKHFICDGLLQTKYHLGKFNDKFKDYFLPLISHANINAVGAMAVVSLWYWITGGGKVPILLLLEIYFLELILHFIIDRIKASKKLLNRWTKDEPMFWHVLMLDQLLHRLCYVFYVMIIMGILL